MKPCSKAFAGIVLGAILSATGCHKTAVTPVAATSAPTPTGAQQAPPPPPPAPAATPEQLAQAHVNEAGYVPILEYHDIGPKEDARRFMRSVDNFKHDLERLYSEGYRPILLHDYLNNRIALPLGMSPVILTFDDARASQFRYLPDGSLDPNCALGILEAFAKEHPDFPVKATFYVLPESAFGQPPFAAKKMQEILALGCEIGNHTVTHGNLKRMSDAQVQKELGLAVAEILKLAPQAKVDTVALPMGIAPRNRALLKSGEYQGTHYSNRAVLLVGANPAHTPVSPKFDLMRLPRIQAQDGIAGSTQWLNYLKDHPGSRYVSDGDPNTITIQKAMEEKIDKSKLNGAKLRTY